MMRPIWNSDIYIAIQALSRKVDRLLQTLEKDMSALDDAIAGLVTQANANADVEASAIDAINKLAGLIQANATDPQTVTDLAAKLKASADALGTAIANDGH